MGKKAASAATVIGGSDGPTSIFLAGGGNTKEKNLYRRWVTAYRNARYRHKRAKAERSVRPGTHSMDEVEAYMIERYGAVEVPHTDQTYLENCKNMRAALAMKYYPELVGERPQKPDREALQKMDEAERREVLEKFMEECTRMQERAAALPESLVPLDYHCYQITPGEWSSVHIELEKAHGLMMGGCSASNMRCHGGKRLMKEAQGIMADIHRYYGVTEEDIRQKSERYHDLVVVLTNVM
ncbi:MAG: sodium ion-translocating decarboxylase subunit beta [bacterium]|nr:sodium ion-translocating decarboxylase subunit beta [bacterium]